MYTVCLDKPTFEKHEGMFAAIKESQIIYRNKVGHDGHWNREGSYTEYLCNDRRVVKKS